MNEPGLPLLLSREGFELLESLAKLGPYSEALAQRLQSGLRKRGIAPELVAAVLNQLQLRTQAQAKFGDFAAGMLLTRAGLEQATRLVVAAFHAARFRAAGCRRVADLGCGLGAESLAFAGVGLQVEAYEMDEATASFALMNLRAFPQACVAQADYLTLDWAQLRERGVDGAFADPARRDQKGRVLRPEQWQPPLGKILDLAAEVPGGNLGVKVAPGVDYGALPANAQVEWVSVQGEVVEAGIWLGGLRRPPAATPKTELETATNSGGLEPGQTPPDLEPGRSALLLDAAGKVRAWLADPESADPRLPAALAPALKSPQQLGTYLFEPDGAVIRAGLTSVAAELVKGETISNQIAYISTNRLPQIDSRLRALGSWFEIEEVLPLQPKVLRRALSTRQVRNLEIKKRGADINPAALRKQVLSRPDSQGEDLVLVATRVAGSHRALLAKRVQ